MIKFAKYPPLVEEHEDQIKDMLNRYMYHLVQDDDKDIDFSFMKDNMFLVFETETAKKIDFALSSFSAALQLQEDDDPRIQEIAKRVLEIKKPIKIVEKGKDNGIL